MLDVALQVFNINLNRPLLQLVMFAALAIDNLHLNSRKELITICKVSKIWLRNVVKCGKYILAKFANFVYVCITVLGEIVTIFEPQMVTISARNTNIQNLKTLQDYIFQTLQQPNFAILLISLCSF
jgi:hypothetical protein